MASILRIPSSSLALMLAIIVKYGENAWNEKAFEEIRDYPVLTILGHYRFTTRYYDGLEYPPFQAWAAILATFADQADMFLAWNQVENRLWRLLATLVIGLRANKHDGTNPREAKKLLVKASSTFLRGAPLPTQDARPRVYANIQNGIELCILLHSYLNTAVCCEALGEYAEALAWLHEFHVLDRTVRYNTTRSKPLWDWESYYSRTESFYATIASYRSTLGSTCLSIYNTGAAAFWFWSGFKFLPIEDPLVANSSILVRSAHNILKKADSISKYLHPEPSLLDRVYLKEPSLQVLGSWQKHIPESGKNLPSRAGCGTFVHKGYMYVLGGDKTLRGIHYRDFWRIKLSTCKKWERLPDYPRRRGRDLKNLSTFEFGIDHKREIAYYFTGIPMIDVFNLQTLEWGEVWTGYKEKPKQKRNSMWPYGMGIKSVPAMSVQSLGDKMYVFGGEPMATQLGCNLLMELDFMTLEWKKLSGDEGWNRKPPGYDEPGPRTNASMWIDEKGMRLYVMYGDANRLGAKLNREEAGDFNSHPYSDIWSWDLVKGGWREERIAGNPPSPRTEMAVAYNRTTDHVFAFGGYCPTARSTASSGEKVEFTFSYYADTFAAKLDRNADSTISLQWKQVLTRGFPTYRAAGKFVVDDTTGKTYLFSGYVNTEYLPSDKGDGSSRSFGDIWELRVDVPGSGWENARVDLEDEARNAAAGPWQRCFTCGDFGSCKKCGGSCNGRVHFCGKACLRDGWSEHKKLHGCRKV